MRGIILFETCMVLMIAQTRLTQDKVTATAPNEAREYAPVAFNSIHISNLFTIRHMVLINSIFDGSMC